MSDVLGKNVGHVLQNVGHVRMSDDFSYTLSESPLKCDFETDLANMFGFEEKMDILQQILFKFI